VGADTDGIITTDAGYQGLAGFGSRISEDESMITLRMLDTETNLAILDDEEAQERIIDDLLTVLDSYPAEGVVLDLEISAIPFTDVERGITEFVARLSSALHRDEYLLGMTVYGDTFYRARPYNLEVLSDSVDEFYIMAYDFHKSRGEPGPNFPLKGKDTYGYDFQTMVQDITRVVPRDAVTIVYGMYGYDWTLGPQGKPLKQARAKTVLDIQKEFYPCSYDDCVIVKDEKSGETKVTYKDDEGYQHVLWYEDEDSVILKEQYANEQGISGKGYWTYGYF
jgi:spore germination protein YaaH